MRLVRLVAALAAAFTTIPTAHADLMGRVLLQPADPPGTGAALPPPAAPAPQDLSAWTGPARQTSLPELLSLAVKQNPALASAKIDTAIAEARIMQTWARDDWQLRMQANAVRSDGGRINNQPVDRVIFGGGTADLFRVLPSGGTLTFHAETGYQSVAMTSPIADMIFGGETWQHDVWVNISQPLLRNRGRFIYEATERRATLARDATVLARRLVAIQTVQTVVAAYWDLVLAERQVAITRASLDLAKERLRITEIGNQGGKVPRSEIPAVQQIIAFREEDVLNGELGVLDRSIALRRAVSMQIGAGELVLRVGTDLDTRDAAFPLGDLTERAFAASPELAQLAKQDAAARIDVEVTENGLLPQLDAAITIGPRGVDGNIGTAARNLVTLDVLSVGGTLTLNHSFGQENIRGLAREQRENRRKIEVTANDVRMQIAQTMARAVAQLEVAKRRIVIAQRAIDLANENIKIETDRFNLGKATNFDVLNRQEELRQAELRKAQAMIDWHKAEASVQALTGDILPAYGIGLE